MIELTEEQSRALGAEQPLHLLDPHTATVYVLVRQDVFEIARRITSGPNRVGWDNPADDDLIGGSP